MSLTEYFAKAFAAWFLGFAPLFEIYVAVPAAIAMGLGYGSVISWTVFGNYTPVILIHFLYETMSKHERVNRWFAKLTSEKLNTSVNRHGLWFVLVVTPWTGVWVMAVTMKALKLDGKKLLLYSFISVTAYAVVITLVIALGIDVFVE